jgi:hypothetical protein
VGSKTAHFGVLDQTQWKYGEENVAVNAEPVLNNRKKPVITSDKRKQSISFLLMMRMKPDTKPQILPQCQMQCF